MNELIKLFQQGKLTPSGTEILKKALKNDAKLRIMEGSLPIISRLQIINNIKNIKK